MQNISVTVSTHPQHKDITLLTVKGSIDTTTAPEFDKAFQAALAEKKFNLIVDLKETNYVSSAGWGLFVGEIKRIRTQKGDLFLAGMSTEVTEAYDLLQFSTILKSYPNVESAVQNGFRKSRADRGPQIPQAQTAQAAAGKPRIEMENLEEPIAEKEPRKLNWFVRMLLPWKWF